MCRGDLWSLVLRSTRVKGRSEISSGLRLKHPEIAEKIKNDRAAREVMGWEGVASQRLQRSGLVRYYLLLQVPQVVDKLVLI